MISIVIPLYDKAAQVADSLESIRRQVFTEYEVLIVDDGSTDGSLNVVWRYLQEHVEFAGQVRVFPQVHAGVSAARNRGIRESRFKWIAFLDADDCWTRDYLQSQYELSLRYPSCEVLAAAYGFRQETGEPKPIGLSKMPFSGPVGVLNNYFEVAACSYPPLCSLITMVRKSSLEAIGGFPEGVSSGEDLLTWARLAIFCRIAYNRKCMGIYEGNPARQNADQRRRMPAREDVVGDGLETLLREHGWIPGLRDYVGAWHKMRARIYLAHSMRREAWAEWRKMVRFRPVDYKTWAYLLLFATPIKL
ncbi:MAG TPA: glycosyltransferase family A protein [Puia sp.]